MKIRVNKIPKKKPMRLENVIPLSQIRVPPGKIQWNISAMISKYARWSY